MRDPDGTTIEFMQAAEKLTHECSEFSDWTLGVERWTFAWRYICSDNVMTFSTHEDFALKLDAEDPLRDFREKFHLPLGKDGKPLIYFAGNSLGLMPKSARKIVEEELDNWAKLGVDAHHARERRGIRITKRCANRRRGWLAQSRSR